MERFLMNELVAWKNSRRRKPLILNGARQVGKTWLLKEFGKTQFEKTAYVSLDANEAARALFDANFDMGRIIDGLSLLTGVRIEPSSTLVILDEIQSAPKALTALKYFCEEASDYAVAAAGSLLGISAMEGSGYPVGKVDTLDLPSEIGKRSPLSDTALLVVCRLLWMSLRRRGTMGLSVKFKSRYLRTTNETLPSIFPCVCIRGSMRFGTPFRRTFPMRTKSSYSVVFAKVPGRKTSKNLSCGWSRPV